MSRTLPIRLSSEVSHLLADESQRTGISQSKLLQNAYLKQNPEHHEFNVLFTQRNFEFANNIKSQLSYFLQSADINSSVAQDIRVTILLRLAFDVQFCRDFRHSFNPDDPESLFEYWLNRIGWTFDVHAVLPKDFVERHDEYLNDFARAIQSFSDVPGNTSRDKSLRFFLSTHGSKILLDSMSSDLRFLQQGFELDSDRLEKVCQQLMDVLYRD